MSPRDAKRKDKTVLSYYEALLRDSDVELLRGPHWLNDAVVGFYFEYLEHKDEKSPNCERDVLFVSPSMAQLLKLTEAEFHASLLEPLDAKRYSYVLFPLNDCESRDTAGGSHWSLLVFSKKENACFHLDSCRGTNGRIALHFARNIMGYLSDSSHENKFEEVNCPQQENGYDCGLFAICLADIVLRSVVEHPEIRKCNFSSAASLVRTKRDELLRLIDELKNMPQK